MSVGYGGWSVRHQLESIFLKYESVQDWKVFSICHYAKPRCTSSRDSKATADVLARKSGPVHFTGQAFWKRHEGVGWFVCSSVFPPILLLSLISISFLMISPL